MSNYYYRPDLTQPCEPVASIYAIAETPALLRSDFRLDDPPTETLGDLSRHTHVVPTPTGLMTPPFLAMDAEFKAATPAAYMCHEDENGDGITESVAVFSRDFREPLLGDYRGVELCRIRYIPCRQDSILRAISLAKAVMATAGRSPECGDYSHS